MKDKRRCFLLLLYLVSFLLLVLFPDFFADSLRSGIALCFRNLIPALFPHLFLASFLVKSGAAAGGKWLRKLTRHLFHLNENCSAVLLLGNFSGYPTGAKATAALYREKQISKHDAERLLFFSCNAGPGFIFGAVGGSIYGSLAVGASLFFIHIAAALLCSLLQSRAQEGSRTDSTHALPTPNLSVSLVESVCDAATTMGKICAFVCLFSTLIQGEAALLQNSEVMRTILGGLTELSYGCADTAQAQLSWTMKFVLTAGFIGFGGLCVTAQTAAVLGGSGLSIKPYITGKLLHGMISALLAWPVSYWIRPLAAAASQTLLIQPFSPLPWRILSLGMVFLIFLQFPAGNPTGDRL